MGKLVFARYGGLSPVNYKRGSDFTKVPFHHPPTKKGIYAFIYPYTDPYFWAWNKTRYNNVINHKEFIRKFHYDGDIWCHFTHLFPDRLIVGSWVKITTNELKTALKAVRKEDTKQSATTWNNLEKYPYIVIKDPYKHVGRISTDHLEVFIDSKNTAKIR
jgi:hypothetical protein